MDTDNVDRPRIERAVREILIAIGEDPDREGLQGTPARVARMYAELFSGLHEDPRQHVQRFFTETCDEVVLVRDIAFNSMCEHHLLPFMGKAHVAYLPGDAVGALRRGIDREEVERGQVLAAPGTIKPHVEAETEVYVLSKEEGGRHTPFFNGYKPQFYIRTTDVTGSIGLPQGVEMVMPGDNIKMTIKLIYPVALEKGLRFAIREGGKTVGAGTVTRIIE